MSITLGTIAAFGLAYIFMMRRHRAVSLPQTQPELAPRYFNQEERLRLALYREHRSHGEMKAIRL